MESELAQTLRLAAEATHPGLKAALNSYAASLPPAPAAAAVPAPAVAETSPVVVAAAPAATPAAVASAPSRATAAAASSTGVTKYSPIDDFAWDQGGYNSETITIYVDLEGVGAVKDAVGCSFSKGGFDLTVRGLSGLNYRLVKDNLEKDIVPADSKIIVKRDKVVIKLKKVKGEYSYEHWGNLTSKKGKEETAAKKKADPMGGIMDMMKDMYNDGDDNMKKIIGEAMLKSQRGENPEMPKGDDNDKF
jgi:calcyclin binding protein